MKTKVLFLDKSRVFSGAEYSLVQLIQALDRSEFVPLICSDYPMSHQRRFQDEAAVELCLLANGLKWWMGSERWSHPVRGTDFLKRFLLGHRLQRVARGKECQILHHNLLFPNSFFDLWSAKLHGMLTVGHVRSIAPWYRLSPRLLRLCDVVICVSEAVKRDVLSWADHPEVHAIHDPIDMSRYECRLDKTASRRALGLPADKRIVSSVALLSPHKGHDDAIRAFSHICDEFPDVLLLIAGGPPVATDGEGSELRRLKGIADELGVANRVVFTEKQVPNVEVVYAASELVCALTIPGEAFGRVVLEAAASRRIVIGTNKGATPEIVQDGKTGFLVPPCDPRSVSDRIRQILGCPTGFVAIAEAAYDHVATNFSPDRYANKVQSLYRLLLRKNRP